jgi:hypothetical protein
MTEGLTRRSFNGLLVCGGVAATLELRALVGAEPALTPAGKIKPRKSADIAASPLSVGFETLDRRCFEPEKTYTLLSELGVKWARCQTGWARTETKKGVYDFAWLDEVVDSLRKLSITPWFNFGYGNKLYSPDAPDEAAVGWAPVFSDEQKAAWVKFTGAIAERFKDRVKHWEIWNESNITAFWQPGKPNPAAYVELLKLTVPEIRRRIPDAVIVGGAYAGIPLDYIRQCLEKGMGEFIDKLSYHPYRPIPEKGYDKEIAALRELIAKHKPGCEIWQGENGAPSDPKTSGALSNMPWNEQRQAKWVLRRILSDLRLNVELASYYHTVDLVGYTHGTQRTPKTNFKGLLRGKEYTPKPAYFAYQSLCALFDAETKRAAKLDVQVADAKAETIHAAGFTRRGSALAAYWHAADLMKDAPEETVTVSIAGDDAKLAEPLLLDPLTQQAYKLPAPQKDGAKTVFKGLPLRDYPLLIADRAAVELA